MHAMFRSLYLYALSPSLCVTHYYFRIFHLHACYTLIIFSHFITYSYDFIILYGRVNHYLCGITHTRVNRHHDKILFLVIKRVIESHYIHRILLQYRSCIIDISNSIYGRIYHFRMVRIVNFYFYR